VPVVFVLVDALRSDYLQVHKSAPFLSHCAENGVYVEKVRPSLGFCERVEILTGVGFPENGYFSAIGRKRSQINPYIFLKACPARWRDSLLFRKVLKRIMWKFKVRLQPYEIPLGLLPELVLTEDAKSHQEKEAFQIESLSDVFAEDGKKISWHFAALGLHNGTDEDRINALKESFCKQEADLYFLYLSPLDIAAHKYGPLSPQVGEVLHTVDAKIEALFEFMKKKDPSSILLVLGDHGMAEVAETLDVESVLQDVAQGFGLKQREDFTYFLDSTTCRIWGESQRFEGQEDAFLKCLEQRFAGTGQWLTGEWDKTLYGEHIWVCSEGVLVFPDFFHRSGASYKGMHGYAPDSPALQGLGIIYSADKKTAPSFIEKGSLSEVAATLCDLCGVRYPKQANGVSWINRTPEMPVE